MKHVPYVVCVNTLPASIYQRIEIGFCYVFSTVQQCYNQMERILMNLKRLLVGEDFRRTSKNGWTCNCSERWPHTPWRLRLHLDACRFAVCSLCDHHFVVSFGASPFAPPFRSVFCAWTKRSTFHILPLVADSVHSLRRHLSGQAFCDVPLCLVFTATLCAHPSGFLCKRCKLRVFAPRQTQMYYYIRKLCYRTIAPYCSTCLVNGTVANILSLTHTFYTIVYTYTYVHISSSRIWPRQQIYYIHDVILICNNKNRRKRGLRATCMSICRESRWKLP